MENVIRLANDFVLQQGIRSLPIKKRDMFELCKSIGYVLMPYSAAGEVIGMLSAEEYTKCPAFFINMQNCKVILFDETKSIGTQLFSIAHEIGHIALHHTYSGVLGNSAADTVQEAEADAFAYALLAPLAVLHDRGVKTVAQIQSETLLDRNRAMHIYAMLSEYKPSERDRALVMQFREYPRRDLRKNIVFAVSCIVALSVLLIAKLAPPAGSNPAQTASTQETLSISSMREKTEQTDVTTEATAINDESKTETVYITQYGARYHKIDCYQIRDNSTRAVTLSEAVALGKTPCKSCYGE